MEVEVGEGGEGVYLPEKCFFFQPKCFFKSAFISFFLSTSQHFHLNNVAA